MNEYQSCIAQTKQGALQGTREGNLVVFKGVPYAAPPVGDLRWMPPQPASAWEGVRDAREFGTIAPQNLMPGGLIASMEPEPQNEDCLFLNVFTPGLDGKRRPVMVWIHGGAFSIGSGSDVTYRNGMIADRGDVVLVTINYRLGALGFLNFEKVTGGKIPATGNEGLLDQIAALEWVRDNITEFGGNPEDVTIFGESAGGMSVGCLMVMPKARGLFHKAIIESPVGGLARPLDMSVNTTEVFLKLAGISGGDTDELRSLSVEKILEIQNKTAMETGQGMAPCIPVADGVILPEMPLDMFSAGKGAPVPAIIGTNLEEQKLFSMMNPEGLNMDEPGLIKAVSEGVLAGMASEVITSYKVAREKRGAPVTPFELYCAIYSDFMFRNVGLHMVTSQRDQGIPTYNYLFTWESPAANGLLGATHAVEIGFVFGRLDPMFNGSGPAAETLSQQMQDAWIAFARTGKPDCDRLGEWPEYGKDRNTMVFSGDSHVEKAAFEAERAVWDKIGDVNLNMMA